MFDLTGMTALVTGASGGIGSAIAGALAAQGARLAVSGSNAEKLEAFRAGLGGDHVALPCNLSDAAAVDAHRQRFGRTRAFEALQPRAQPAQGGAHQSTGTACSTALASAAPLPASASPTRRWPATAMNSACTSSGRTWLRPSSSA